MVQSVQDDDACALGRCLAEHLQHTELVIHPPSDSADSSHSRGSGPTPFNVLEVCIQSLAKSEDPTDLDAAAVLELHNLLMTKQFQKALGRAEDELGRNPNLGYAYCLAHLDFFFLRQRAINMALGSYDLTPFQRRELLCESIKLLAEHGC